MIKPDFSLIELPSEFNERRDDDTAWITRNSVTRLVKKCHQASVDASWWKGVDIDNPYVVPAKMALIHSEISEALEGHRKDLQDAHLPHRKSVEVELADAIIRIADLAGALQLDLGGALVEKMAYNKTRLDHKLENRAKDGGKKY